MNKWLIVLIQRYILLVQIFALALLVGCRAQSAADQERWEAEKAEMIAAHEAELAYVQAGLDTSGVYPHKAEAEEIARVLYGTARFNSSGDQRLVVWCILNRFENDAYPDTIIGVCEQDQQWMGYSKENPILQELYDIASGELTNYYCGSYRPVGPEFVFLSWTSEEIVLRDSFEETAQTHYWRS